MTKKNLFGRVFVWSGPTGNSDTNPLGQNSARYISRQLKLDLDICVDVKYKGDYSVPMYT